jgi:tRNA G18 (ribose-2'-O)-methylase SpoU
MVTDRYLHVVHHPTVADLAGWAATAGTCGTSLPLLGIDNVPGSVPLEGYPMPLGCVLLLGQEGTGLSDEAVRASAAVLSIAQFGSTRSINAGAAAAIAMHAWVRRHAVGAADPPVRG